MRRLLCLIGLMGLVACNRLRAPECRDGASCYDQARDLMREIYRRGGDGKERTAQETADERAKALALYQKGCDLGSAGSCNELGSSLESGDLTAPDLPRAARVFERGCDLKEFRACDKLARLYEDGRGVPEDAALQAKYRKLACDLAEPPMAKDAFCVRYTVDDALRHDCNDKETCYEEGQLLMGRFFDVKAGRKRATPETAAQLASRAVIFFQRGCELGHGRSCAALGEEFRIGGLAGIDLPRAARLFEKGCGLKDIGACDELAKFYRDGAGVRQNRPLEAKYRKLACDLAKDDMEKETFCKSNE